MSALKTAQQTEFISITLTGNCFFPPCELIKITCLLKMPPTNLLVGPCNTTKIGMYLDLRHHTEHAVLCMTVQYVQADN